MGYGSIDAGSNADSPLKGSEQLLGSMIFSSTIQNSLSFD
jgi:hypothetical protein